MTAGDPVSLTRQRDALISHEICKGKRRFLHIMEKSTHSRHCIGEKKGKPRNPRRDCDNGLARRLYSRLSVRTSLMSLALATLLPHHRFPGNQRFHPPSPCSTKVSSPHRIESHWLLSSFFPRFFTFHCPPLSLQILAPTAARRASLIRSRGCGRRCPHR